MRRLDSTYHDRAGFEPSGEPLEDLDTELPLPGTEQLARAHVTRFPSRFPSLSSMKSVGTSSLNVITESERAHWGLYPSRYASRSQPNTS